MKRAVLPGPDPELAPLYDSTAAVGTVSTTTASRRGVVRIPTAALVRVLGLGAARSCRDVYALLMRKVLQVVTESDFVIARARAEFLPPRDIPLREQPETLADDAVMREVWRDNVYRLQGGILSGGTVVDLGACFGAFTLLALATHPDERVIAVEPDPQNMEMLRENAALNDWQGRLDPWTVAVGAHGGEGVLEGTGPEATVEPHRKGDVPIKSLAEGDRGAR